MRRFRDVLFAMAAIALAACGIGAREVDRSPQRNFSADIAAALDHGPTATHPGMLARQEPIGAIPWRSHDRDPYGR
jgi:hypothetical protein